MDKSFIISELDFEELEVELTAKIEKFIDDDLDLLLYLEKQNP